MQKYSLWPHNRHTRCVIHSMCAELMQFSAATSTNLAGFSAKCLSHDHKPVNCWCIRKWIALKIAFMITFLTYVRPPTKELAVVCMIDGITYHLKCHRLQVMWLDWDTYLMLPAKCCIIHFNVTALEANYVVGPDWMLASCNCHSGWHHEHMP